MPEQPNTDAVVRTLAGLDPLPVLLLGLAGLLVGVLLFRRFAVPAAGRLPPPPAPSRRLSLSLVAGCFAVYLLGGFWLAQVLRRSPEGSVLREQPLVAAFAAQLGAGLATVLLALLVVRRRGGTGADLGISGRHPVRSLHLGLLTFLVILPALLGAVGLERSAWLLAGREPPVQAAVAELAFNEGVRSNPLVLVHVILLVPFLEELLFRGLLLAVLLRWLPAAAALITAALLFALQHDAGWLPVFVQGLALSWLYWRSRTLLAPTVMHVAHNGLAVLLILTTGDASHEAVP